MSTMSRANGAFRTSILLALHRPNTERRMARIMLLQLILVLGLLAIGFGLSIGLDDACDRTDDRLIRVTGLKIL